MKIIAIIPARMSSSRLKGKPLKKICGMEMIGHCYKRVSLSKKMNEVYVATCDNEIVKYIKSINGNVILTSKKHTRATDRVAEALKKIEKIKNKKFDIVVMVQGDEPLITPKMLDKSLFSMHNKSVNIVNLMTKIVDNKEINDKNEIKVIFNRNKNAICFSREAIPSSYHATEKINYYKQVCIFPFKRNFLLKFNKMKETSLEKAESVDMMRLIENNVQIKMVETNDYTKSVDTYNDLKIVNALMKKDKYFKKKYK